MFRGVRAQKTLKNGHFMDVESIQKTFNFTTTNAIMMILNTDIYLSKDISWSTTHKTQEGIN